MFCSSKSVYNPSMWRDPLDSDFESIMDKDMYDISEQGLEYSENMEEESDFYVNDNYNK